MRAVVLLLLVSLAGCASDEGTETCPEPCNIGATEPGSLTVIVVDEAVQPLPGAAVQVLGTGHEAITDEDGAAAFTDLEPGTYAVQASHPLFDVQQATTTVAADERGLIRLQLTRIVFEDPYIIQQEVKGYLFCSSNAGGIIAEECGEGAGVPCEAPGVGPIPVVGCQRVGGAPDNLPEARFFTDGGLIRTIQAEVVWDPTLTLGNGIQEGGFTAILATDFVCDPVCRYEHKLDAKVGHSPMIMRTDDGPEGGSTSYFTEADVPLAEANLTAETPVSVFVWTSDEDLAAVTFDQPFTAYVTASYVLPLPEDWSFARGDEPPF